MFLGYPTRVQVFIIFGLSHVPGISNKGAGIHHPWTIPCSWDIQQGGDLRALINHYLPRKGENQMFVTLLCCCRYSPARSGWKQIKWGISISLTRFRGTPIHPTIQKKKSIFSVSHTKLISKHSLSTSQCRFIQISTS